MAAVTKQRPVSGEGSYLNPCSARPLHLLQGSFSPRRDARRFPLLSSLHRITDGAVLGVLVAVGLTATLSFHLRHLWTVAFTRLEVTRTLAHRLTDSTAMLESHFLQETNLPKAMVPTKVSNLLYLDHPSSYSAPDDSVDTPFLSRYVNLPINHGY